MIFNNTIWTSITQAWGLIYKMIKFWVILTPEVDKALMEAFLEALRKLLQQPLMILSG